MRIAISVALAPRLGAIHVSSCDNPVYAPKLPRQNLRARAPEVSGECQNGAGMSIKSVMLESDGVAAVPPAYQDEQSSDISISETRGVKLPCDDATGDDMITLRHTTPT